MRDTDSVGRVFSPMDGVGSQPELKSPTKHGPPFPRKKTPTTKSFRITLFQPAGVGSQNMRVRATMGTMVRNSAVAKGCSSPLKNVTVAGRELLLPHTVTNRLPRHPRSHISAFKKKKNHKKEKKSQPGF